MMQDQTKIEEASEQAVENGDMPPPRYFIDEGQAERLRRSLSLMVASRRCYTCQQGDVEPPASSDVQPFIDRIAEHCALTSDYLLPDTPLKEAIFRVILAGGNKPMTAEEISEILSEKWAMTAYPRVVSSSVIGRLLDNSESYCIVQAAETDK